MALIEIVDLPSYKMDQNGGLFHRFWYVKSRPGIGLAMSRCLYEDGPVLADIWCSPNVSLTS